MLYNNLDYLERYKVVTTFSENFLKEILAKDQNNQLKNLNLKVTSCGVLTDFFNPENGLLIPQSYSITSQDGKENCKRRLLNKIGTNLDKCVFLTACRLVEDKGIEDIIKIVPLFEKLNAILIVIGNGDKNYEEQLRKLS
jgi:glycogen synthase